MNESLKDGLIFFVGIMIFAIMLGSMFILLLASVEHMNYSYYKSEGYKVSYDFFEGCKMKLNNPDGTQSWRSCSPGDEHVIENYGVRR